ncbi:MAG: hypothetical protein ABW127_06940 [Candidatus Thiodiazotropha endolucinida]
MNKKTGFEILESEEGTPGRILSLSRDHTTSGIHMVPVNLSIAILARKIGVPDPDLSWNIPISSILQTSYPKDTAT